MLTLGRNSHPENILLDAASLAARGFEVHEAGRGGDVTYHGPGQLVGYPVLALADDEKDAHAYLRRLEEVLIAALARLGVSADRHPPHTGVWVEHEGAPKKVAAIGVRLSRWVTSHGFALNVDCDLEDFEVIVPCGIRDHEVTSIAHVADRTPSMAEVGMLVQEEFGRVFGRQMEVFEEVR